MQAIGLFGGAFDPVHHGHLRLALECRERLDLAEVRLIPTGQPPHRAPAQASAAQRLAMLQLAVDGADGLVCDASELQHPGPSYTVDTVERLRAASGQEQPLVWILGLDAFLGLPSWHRWEELCTFVHLLVIQRPGYRFEAGLHPQLAELQRQCGSDDAGALRLSPAGRLHFLPLPQLDISSTALRAATRAGHSCRYLVPDAVQAFINTHHIYH